jgi:uncharacterized DUF497 family protein
MDPAKEAPHLVLAECKDCSRHELRKPLQTREAMHQGAPDEEAAAVEAILPDVEEEGRIVSARRATSHERVAYEEGEF